MRSQNLRYLVKIKVSIELGFQTDVIGESFKFHKELIIHWLFRKPVILL